MQALLLLDEHLDRCPPGHPMLTAVDLGHPRLTRIDQLRPRPVAVPQVGVGWHQVGLGDPHRRLAATLGFRIRRHTRRDRHAVVAADRDHLRMPDRHAGDVVDRDGALVVGQPIRRCTTKGPHGTVDTADHRRQPAIPARNHDPEPRPRQPRAEQQRRLRTDRRTGAPVPLGPHPRLGDPRPIHPPPTTPMVGLHLGDRSAHRAFRTGVTERSELVEGHVGTNLGVRPLDPLLDLRQERVDNPLPPLRSAAKQLAGVALGDIAGHGVMRHAGQLAGATQRPSQVERFQHIHDLLARLHSLLLLDSHRRRDRPFE